MNSNFTSGNHQYSKVGIVIQARMGSSRLPGKVMKQINGQPLLGLLLDRLQNFDLSGAEVVVATTDREEDEQISSFCETLGIRCISGSELNVFERFQKVALTTNFDHIVRLTADNPLVSEKVLSFAMKSHVQSNADLSSTRKIVGDKVTERYVPKGYSIDVIKCKTLLDIASKELTPFCKEHVIPVFFNEIYTVNYLKPEVPRLQEMTIDTQEDFDRVSGYLRKFEIGK